MVLVNVTYILAHMLLKDAHRQIMTSTE